MRKRLADKGSRAFGLATLGVAAAGVLTWFLLTQSVYGHAVSCSNPPCSSLDDGTTLLAVNHGLLAHVVVWAPLVLASLIWVALHLACRHDSAPWRDVAVGLGSLLGIGCLLAGFSVGLLAL